MNPRPRILRSWYYMLSSSSIIPPETDEQDRQPASPNFYLTVRLRVYLRASLMRRPLYLSYKHLKRGGIAGCLGR